MEILNENINKDRENIFKNYDIISKIESLSKLAFILATQNMETLKNLDEERALKYSVYIKNLYIFILENPNYFECKEIFIEKINSMTKNTFGSSHIYASCISNFLEASDTNSIAYFLNGIFLIARDILFINNDLIKEIDKVIKNIEENKFIEILPNLRFAFTNLTPSETETLSSIIEKLYKTKKLNAKNISEEEIKKAFSIDKKIAIIILYVLLT